MITNISFKIEWDNAPDKSSGLTIKDIYCGNTDGKPVPIHLAILEMMMLVDDNLNGGDPVGGPSSQEIQEFKAKAEAKEDEIASLKRQIEEMDLTLKGRNKTIERLQQEVKDMQTSAMASKLADAVPDLPAPPRRKR